MADDTQAQLPAPAPALRRLDRFVGTWSMEGHLVGSDEITVRGETTFRWLPGGFFLEQAWTPQLPGLGDRELELIGYDPETETFPSSVFSNISPTPLPYRWEVDDDTLEDLGDLWPVGRDVHRQPRRGRPGFRGGWRPNPGADETVNVPYDIGGRRRT